MDCYIRRVTFWEMQMRKLFGVMLVACALAVAGCKDAKTNSASATEVVIGEYAALTGPTATFGKSSHEGIMMAVEEANAAGGLLGKKIKVITEDNRGDANEAVTTVQKLISKDHV